MNKIIKEIKEHDVIAIQRFLGEIFITVFFTYLAYLIYPANQILALFVFLFGLLLAWGK